MEAGSVQLAGPPNEGRRGDRVRAVDDAHQVLPVDQQDGRHGLDLGSPEHAGGE